VLRWGEVNVRESPDPVDKLVGSRLRMRRWTLRITQRKLGYKLSLTF
jgi:hypothetical protein